ncbi:MAG: flagellar motor switch protein FliN [Methylococcales bacterium]|nr:MAG: flagellar motor switch protein FliN [Methylococcales bacterium]
MSELDLGEDDWAAALSEQAEAEGTTTNESINTDNFDVKNTDVFKDLSKNHNENATNTDIEFILDIPVQLTVELGRTKITIKNLVQLTQGSVIELNGLAGEPLDVLVNGCLIAHGEVVVVNDKFGIRLIDIANPAERLQRINK